LSHGGLTTPGCQLSPGTRLDDGPAGSWSAKFASRSSQRPCNPLVRRAAPEPGFCSKKTAAEANASAYGGVRVYVNAVDPRRWRSKESFGSCPCLVSDDPLDDDGIDAAVLHDPWQACHQASVVRAVGNVQHFDQARAATETGVTSQSDLSVCRHGNTQRNVLRTGPLHLHVDAQPQRTAPIPQRSGQ